MVFEALAHRGGLVQKTHPDQTLFRRIGGRPVIDRMIDELYNRIEEDPALRPMFPRTLTNERMKQKAFFEEWMGGDPSYTHHHAYGGLKGRHRHIHITREAADGWLDHIKAAFQAAVDDEVLIDEALGVLKSMAYGLINEDQPAQSPKDLRCHRENRWRKPLVLAAKGQREELQHCIEADPGVLKDPTQTARMMYEATARGHIHMVAYLLTHGVDVNLPAVSVTGLMMTPLCAARWKKQHALADFLIRQGALYDIFSACFLGDMDVVTHFIETEKLLVNAQDPACDVLPITPLHHAVYGGHEHVVEYLFPQGADVGTNSTPMVRHAAEENQVSLLRLLLTHGADATRIGPGPWVIHPEITDLVLSHGADVNYPPGKWIWVSCTGNNSQRDNPDYVQALLNCGADVNTRLRGAQALHYAAKAGHVGTLEVLLKNNAPVNLPNNNGETPLFYAFKAGKRADIVTTLRLLLEGGADRHHEDNQGRTPEQITRRVRRPEKEEIIRLFENW